MGISVSIVIFVTLSHLLSLISGQSDIPQFTREPADTIGKMDSKVTLSCNAEIDSGGVSYSWSFNGVPIGGASGDPYQFNLTERSEGMYACLATVPKGTIVSRQAKVQVAKFESANLPQMEDKTVAEGEGFSLSCNDYVSVGGVSVLWNKQVNGIQELINAGEVLGTKDKQLYFPHAQSPQHDAVYSCSVVNLVTNVVISGSFNVLVSGTTTEPQPKFLSKPENITVPIGSKAVFQCIPTGDPVPSVTWSGPDGSQINSPSISSVGMNDAGEYTCTVSGQGYSGYLTVVDRPSVSALESNISVRYGGSVSLQCSSNQHGAPDWSWYRNGERVVDDVRTVVSRNSVTLNSVVLKDDGYYQCVSTDEFRQYGSAVIVVSVETVPPTFTDTSELQDMVTFEGDDIELNCHVDAAPPPTFQWTRGSEVLQDSSKYNLRTPGRLIISNVSKDDQGMYGCEATNVIPETGIVVGTISNTRELRVIQPTMLTQISPPLVYRQVKDNPGSILLVCVAEGDPLANITYKWYRNSLPFAPLGGLTSNTAGTIRLTDWSVADSGLYRCLVSTTIGNFSSGSPRTLSSTTNLTIATVPAPPSPGRGTTLSSTKIQLSWDYNGDLDFIRSYTIYKQADGTTGWTYVYELGNSNTFSYQVGRLFPFTNYTFRIEVVDGKQQVANSVSPYFATSEGVPTATPINIRSKIVNMTSLRVFWKPPPLRNIDGTGRNGIITEYMIRYAPPDSDFSRYSFETVTGSQTELYLPGPAFLVSIAASTSEGQGPFTAPTLLNGTESTTPDTPFYQSVWFIVVVTVGGVLILAIIVVTVCICCVCWRRGRKRTFEVNNFRGGDDPHFDVYQYEMEKTTRLRSIRPPPQDVADDYEFYEPEYVYNDQDITNGMVVQDGYPPISDHPQYIPPPAFFTKEGMLMNEQQAIQMGPHMYNRNRALSFEWDPRHPGHFMDQNRMQAEDRRVLHARSLEWNNSNFGYPTEVMMPEHQREVVNVNVGGEGSEDSMQKPPPSDDEDSNSVSQAPTDCSTFV